MRTITLYTKNQCVQCTAAKRLLKQEGVEYEEINVEDKPELLQELKTKGYQSVPILIVEEVILGFHPEKIKAL